MKRSALIALVFVSLGVIASQSATAQNAVLAEMYGRGVHAYYAGNNTDAHTYLSMAIDNGIEDPRAYYFRGMVADASGRPDEAALDWKQGAELEARGRMGPGIGRSLARFQGSSRLKLEEIRQKARLEALASSAARSQQRYGEIEAAEANVLRTVPKASAPPAAAALAPPPAPPAAENPFGDDMAAGEPQVQSDDALADAMNDPFADDGTAAAGAAPAAGAADPFGGNAGAAADPFGTGAGGAADPFGGGAGGAADPFGGGAGGAADPFGGGAMDDPFGN